MTTCHDHPRAFSWVRTPLRIAIPILILLFSHPPAWAHRVNIFAWVQGDTIHTESRFSGGRMAKGADVEVYDEAGNRLVIGKTDASGGFSFKIPKIETLKVALVAGTGHRNSWTIPKAEILAAQTAAGNAPPPNTPEKREIPREKKISERSAAKAIPAVIQNAASPCLTAEQMHAIIGDALDRKLQPIVLRLNRLEAQAKQPQVKDVLGGLGYIFGLMGIAAYVTYRKRTQKVTDK